MLTILHHHHGHHGTALGSNEQPHSLPALLLTDMVLCWSVDLDLFGMCRAQPELDTVMADAPEEVSVVSVDVDEAGEASVMHEPAAPLARVRTCN